MMVGRRFSFWKWSSIFQWNSGSEAGVGDPSFPTRSFVLRYIRQVARRCEEGDWFIWFWAGHGVNVPDFNGDEKAAYIPEI